MVLNVRFWNLNFPANIFFIILESWTHKRTQPWWGGKVKFSLSFFSDNMSWILRMQVLAVITPFLASTRICQNGFFDIISTRLTRNTCLKHFYGTCQNMSWILRMQVLAVITPFLASTRICQNGFFLYYQYSPYSKHLPKAFLWYLPYLHSPKTAISWYSPDSTNLANLANVSVTTNGTQIREHWNVQLFLFWQFKLT